MNRFYPLLACLILCATMSVYSQDLEIATDDTDVVGHPDSPLPVGALPAHEGFLEMQTHHQAEVDADAKADAEADAEAEADAQEEAADQAEADADAEEGADADTDADAESSTTSRSKFFFPWYPDATKVEGCLKKTKKCLKSGPAFKDPSPIPFKIVLHSTEGSTAGGAESTYRVHKGNNPHFTISYEGKPTKKLVVHQHVPLSHASRALEHPKGTCDTNNANAIQIEIVGKAKEAPTWDPALIDGVADLLAWIQHQYPSIKPVAPPKGFIPHPKSYGKKAAQRMDCTTWMAFNGVAGHQHVPNNKHGDPGQVDIAALMKKMVP